MQLLEHAAVSAFGALLVRGDAQSDQCAREAWVLAHKFMQARKEAEEEVAAEQSVFANPVLSPKDLRAGDILMMRKEDGSIPSPEFMYIIRVEGDRVIYNFSGDAEQTYQKTYIGFLEASHEIQFYYYKRNS